MAGDRKAELERAIELLAANMATSGGLMQEKTGKEEEGDLIEGVAEGGQSRNPLLLLPWTDVPLDSVVCRLGTQEHKVWQQGPPPQ